MSSHPHTAPRKTWRIFANRRGATAIEYGLIAALVAVAALGSIKGLGNQMKTTFTTVSSSMAPAS